MKARVKRNSRILEMVHETAGSMYRSGTIDRARMAEFDRLCLDLAPQYSGRKIKALRRRHGVSLETFASLLNTGVTTVRQWETGERRPRGAALRLLEILDRKGLAVLLRD
jgi:putative transcriptional regulator